MWTLAGRNSHVCTKGVAVRCLQGNFVKRPGIARFASLSLDHEGRSAEGGDSQPVEPAEASHAFILAEKPPFQKTRESP